MRLRKKIARINLLKNMLLQMSNNNTGGYLPARGELCQLQRPFRKWND